MVLNKETFKKDFQDKLLKMYQKSLDEATDLEKYITFGTLITEYMGPEWYESKKGSEKEKKKQVYYFSLEFLIGRLMDANLINLGIRDVCEEGLKELGISLKDMEELEPDAGLGNGGLGRLAACFLDSMASIGVTGHGNGIRYKYGLFEQQISNGYQIETPDNWLKIRNVWEVRHDDLAVIVKFGGKCDVTFENNRLVIRHRDYEPILAVPYDMPVPGYRNNQINNLRLWSAETEGSGFDFTSFSRGDYEKATEGQYSVGAITNVLYPDDSTKRGKMLRLKQEYFFTSAGIQSIVNKIKKQGISVRDFDKYVAIHINDTHPALAVAELMRILIDEEELEWDESWDITVKTMGYTNHTILAEALEKWDIDMFKTLLPRIYMIVEEINRRFCVEVSERYNGDWDKLRKMSIIQDGVVKMAHLAIVGSHSVNGVAALHTEILKNRELADFHNFYPGKFNNKTNGITHRRWLMKANPELSKLIDETIGDKWKKVPLELHNIQAHADDRAFQEAFMNVKYNNKTRLADYIKEKCGVVVDPSSIFDIQVKRLHMYKRQILNILHVMDLYNRLQDNPNLDIVPHTYIFAAKAFPSYMIAKNVIKLINTVADAVNNDPRVKDKLKVVFLPNYSVSLAEVMIPGGDVSEQISTASKEASGTGNMKFMMNGAVTCATLDGANVEIREAVGDDNIVLFGMHADEVMNLQANGRYSAQEIIKNNASVSRIIDQIKSGYNHMCTEDEFRLVLNYFLNENDPYYALADFESYKDAQKRINDLYKDRERWTKMAIANTAESGIFSSDYTILRYAKEIWNAEYDKKSGIIL